MPYFGIVAHGMELGLKAILLADGRNEECLMLRGHDLDYCCRVLARGHFDLSNAIGADTVAVVDALSYPHQLQCFRYPQRISEDLPDPASALDCLERLLAIVARHLAVTEPAKQRIL